MASQARADPDAHRRGGPSAQALPGGGRSRRAQINTCGRLRRHTPGDRGSGGLSPGPRPPPQCACVVPSPSPFLVRSLSLPGRVHQTTQGEDLARPVQRHTLYLGFRPAKGPPLRSPGHHLAPLPPVSAFGRAGALLLALRSLMSSCSHAVRFCACAGLLAPYSRRGPCAAPAPHSARAQNFSFLPAVRPVERRPPLGSARALNRT